MNTIPSQQKEYPLSDCELIVNGDTAFYANSTALVTASRVLHDALKSQLSQHYSTTKTTRLHKRITCHVTYLEVKALADLLDFIAKLAVSKEQLSDADLVDLLRPDMLKSRLTVARDFAVPRLIDGIVGSALQNLTDTNCCEILAIAADHDCYCRLLETVATEYITANFYRVAGHPNFLRFMKPNKFRALLASDYLNAPNEADLFDIICSWVNRNRAKRSQHFSSLLSRMRGELVGSLKKRQMSSSEFFNCTQLKDNPEVARWFRSESPASAPSQHPRLPHQAIFQIGGVKRYAPTQWFTISEAVEVYDPLMQSWTVHDKFSPALDTRLALAACVELDSVVYLLGGSSQPKDGNRNELRNMTVWPRVQAFDLRKGVWHDRAPLQVARYSLSGCQCAGLVYAIGGHNGERATKVVEIYQPDRNIWSLGPPLMRRRTEAGAAALHGLIYVCGGRMEGVYHATVEQFSPGAVQWTLVAALPSARAGLSLCAFGSFLYAIGGCNRVEIYRTVYQYNPINDAWHDAPPLNSTRCLFNTCVVYGHMYAIGGRTVTVERPVLGSYSMERCGLDGAWVSLDASSESTENCSCTIYNCDLILPLIKRESAS